jgi:hypothetical protein
LEEKNKKTSPNVPKRQPSMEVGGREERPSTASGLMEASTLLSDVAGNSMMDTFDASGATTLAFSTSMPADLHGTMDETDTSGGTGSRLRMSKYRLTQFQSKTLPDIRSMRALCHDLHFCRALVSDQNHFDAIAMVEYDLEMLYATHDEHSHEVIFVFLYSRSSVSITAYLQILRAKRDLSDLFNSVGRALIEAGRRNYYEAMRLIQRAHSILPLVRI